MPEFSAGEASLKIVPSTKTFREDLEAQMKKIRAEFTIDVKANTAQAAADIDRLRNDQRDRHLYLGVDVALAQARADMEKFREQQRREGLTIKADLDTDPARRKARQLGSDVKNDLKSAFSDIGDGFAGVFDAFKTTSIFAGIGELPAAATAITALTGSLEDLAGAGAALPGIFAGIGSEVGVVKLATMGVSDAFKALDKAQQDSGASAKQQAKDLAATNEALSKLAPQTADFVKQVYSLKPAFDDLQKGVSGRFFDGLGDSVKNLATADLPLLNQGLGGIADALNGSLKQLGISLSSGSSQGLLSRIFGNTAEAQSHLTAAIDPLIQGIGTLTAAGSDVLPRLADEVGHIAQRFSTFITGADKDGSLSKFINDGITGVEHLGDAAINIGKIFNDIVGAAGGGGGFLQFLDDGTKKLDAFLKTPEGQQSLKDFFAEGRKDIGELLEVAKKLPDVLGGIFNAGQDAAGVLLPALDHLLSIINDIPGGAQTVIDAFLLWKGITAASDLVSSFGTLRTLLTSDIPKDAKVAEEALKGVRDAQAGKDVADALDPSTGLPFVAGSAGEKAAAEKAAKKAAEDAAKKIPLAERGPLGKLIAGGGSLLGGSILSLPTAIALPVIGAGATGAYLASEAPDAPGRPGGGQTGRFQKPRPVSGEERLARQRQYDSDAAQDVVSQRQQSAASGDEGPLESVRLAAEKAKTEVDLVANGLTSLPTGTIVLKDQTPEAIDRLKALGIAVQTLPGGQVTIAVQYTLDGRPISLDQLKTPIRVAATPGGTAPTFGGGRAAGGPITGPGAKGKDSVPIMAAPGEHMLTASDVDRMGGQAGVYRFRQALQSGRVPGLAGGGDPLDYLSIATGGAGGTLPGPVAPAPGGGGISSIASSFLGGFGGVLGNIPGLGGSPGGDTAGTNSASKLTPGLAGLFQAGNDPEKLQQFGQQTGDFLGNLASKTLLSFGTTLYQGALGFFGLQDSILSPNNPYFQDIAKGAGFFLGQDGPLGGGNGATSKAPTEKQSREGQQKIVRADQKVSEITQRIAELKPDAKQSQRQTLQDQLANATQDAQDARSDFSTLGSSSASSSGGRVPLGTTPPGTGAARWAPVVQQALQDVGPKYGITNIPAWTDALVGQIQFESGGNPAALNPKDSDGLPAIGLGQFKTGTFNAHNITGGSINDGTAQVYAMIDYVASRYGQDGSGVPRGINQGHGYATGGRVNGSGTGDTVPAMLTPGEHVLTTKDVTALGGQSGVYALREAIHMADGGGVGVPSGVVIRPLPPIPKGPDAQKLIPRAAAPTRPAPTAPLPQPVIPSSPPPTATAPPDPVTQQGQQPGAGPAPVGGSPSSDSHTLPAISKGITSGFATAGSIAQTAASAASFGAAGGLGGGLGGGGGPSIAGLFQQVGKIANDVADVGSAFLVGSVPGSLGDPNLPAYGALQQPQQRQPQTAGDRHYNYFGVDSRNIVDEQRLKDSQDQQAQFATYR